MDLEDDAFRLSANKGKRLNKAQAIAWLKQRNIPVEFYEIAKQVGSKVAHGYMKNAAVYLWNNAEVGTEYHEAFHYVFRTSLSEKQREGLYKEARKRFDLPNATELELEESNGRGVPGLRIYCTRDREDSSWEDPQVLQRFVELH